MDGSRFAYPYPGRPGSGVGGPGKGGDRPTLRVVGGEAVPGAVEFPAPIRIVIDPRGRDQPFIILVSALTPALWATVADEDGRWKYRQHEPTGLYVLRTELRPDGSINEDIEDIEGTAD